MVMLQEGLNDIRDQHSSRMTSFILGTDGTVADETQTGLQSPTAATEIAPTITTTLKTNTLAYTLPSTTGTGATYREGGARNDGSSIDFDRVTWTGIAHTEADDINVRKIYYYRNA